MTLKNIRTPVGTGLAPVRNKLHIKLTDNRKDYPTQAPSDEGAVIFLLKND